MGYVLKGLALCADAWRTVGADEPVPAFGPVIVPASRWSAERDTLAARRDPVGVLVEGEASLDAIAVDLARLALVAVHIPKYADGRGMSTGRLLRERHRFPGELRALGTFLPDQVWELSRCGFDAFVFDDVKRAEHGLAALATFTDAYQSSAAEPQPLFRRRLA
jgi:uncharacterized protein (DUF934 family)